MSILGFHFEDCLGCDPTVKVVKGTAMEKVEESKWLEKIKAQILEATEDSARNTTKKRRRRIITELYTGADPTNGMPPPHMYQGIQFCDKRLLPDDCDAIKVLADGDYKALLEDCHDFDEFLNDNANQARNEIKDVPEFQGAAIRSVSREKSRRAWYEKLRSIETLPNVLDSLSEDQTVLEDPFKQTFRCATFHYQTKGQETDISAYYSHKDKVGNIVGFKPIAGESYNLVAMQSNYPNSGNGKERAAFEKEYDSYESYQSYKETLSESDRKTIDKFESIFMSKATAEGLPRVRVYKLTPGNTLLFAASDYLHGTIIPSQQAGMRRALLVFHDLIPYYAAGSS
jgi:hypothetical protein